MKKLLIILISFSFLFAYKVETKRWSYKDTFYGFLKSHSLPLSIYYNLPADIKRKVRRIPVGETIFLLKNNNNLKQALTPLDNKKQLQTLIKMGNI